MFLTRRGRLALLAFAATGVVVLLILVAGEVLMRVRESRRADVPGTLPLIYYRHERLGRALVRGFDYYGWVRVNEHGFRGEPVSVRPPTGTVRIMTVGASTTFDVCAGRDQDAWPARLEDWLHHRAPGARFEVVNAGVPGYRLIDNIVLLQKRLLDFQPDVMLVLAGHNDLSRAIDLATRHDTGLERRPDEQRPVTPWAAWLQRHSLLYNRLAIRFLQPTWPRRTLSEAEWASALDSAMARFQRDLTSFALIARAAGIELLIIEAPHIAGDTPAPELDSAAASAWRNALPAPIEIVLDGYRRIGEVKRQVADSVGAHFVATAPFGIEGPAFYCDGRDPIHFNTAGAERMAEQLSLALFAPPPLAGVLGAPAALP